MMKTIELTIDGIAVTAEEGTTILNAAKKVGIHIPNMCYDKRLRPYGGCRVCVVEMEGNPRLLASCSTPVSAGMIIKTDTPKLKKIRQTVLELMLVHHPLDCPICDKAGECDLQDIAYQFGKPEGRFIRHRKAMPPDVRGPLVELTANRCILCGKCVRICAEHQGRGALGFIGRGFPTVVQPAFGEILECDYCGQCIDICPTGALLSKPMKFQARAWFMEEKDTICPFCGCGCTLTLGTREGRILRSRAKEDSGRSDGNLCGRGRFGVDFIYSENRLKTPLIRKDGELVPASWDEALAYIGDRLTAILNTHGGDMVGAIGSHRCTNEDNYMLRKFMQDVAGSPNLDSTAAFGHAKVRKVFENAFGSPAAGISMRYPLGRDVILVLESDLSISHPVYALNILQAKRDGSRLIVADGRQTKLTRHSSSHLRLRQGTAVAFVNSLMKVIIDKGLFRREDAAKIPGFPELEKSLAAWTPDKAAAVTGIPEAETIAAAEALAAAKSRMITLTLGIAENTKGADLVAAAANLVNLLGDSPETLQIPAEYANTRGAFAAGMHAEGSSKNVFRMLYEAGAVRALYLMGVDPATTFPFNARLLETLKALDLLIVQDIALTETAKLAHVVLPATSWAEKDGTFINAEGVEQKIHRIIDGPGQSLPDWQIIRNLALTMGKDIGIRSVENLSEGIRKMAAKPAEGRQAFLPVEHAQGEEPDRSFPFALVTRDVLQHSGSMSTRSKALDLVVSEAFLEINNADAHALGITENTHVKLSSRRGAVYLKAKVTEAVPQGTVYTSIHFPHGRVNALTQPPENGTANTAAVKVEAV
ncbi:MAG: molybdopterin-dependent oxidoreductase [Thermodesulfovibrionales bacterium]